MTLEVGLRGQEHRSVVRTAEDLDALVARLRQERPDGSPLLLTATCRDDARAELLEIGIDGDRGFVHRAPLGADAACLACRLDEGEDTATYHVRSPESGELVPAFAEMPYAEVRREVERFLQSCA